jgi:hypothetical protein
MRPRDRYTPRQHHRFDVIGSRVHPFGPFTYEEANGRGITAKCNRGLIWFFLWTKWTFKRTM